MFHAESYQRVSISSFARPKYGCVRGGTEGKRNEVVLSIIIKIINNANNGPSQKSPFAKFMKLF